MSINDDENIDDVDFKDDDELSFADRKALSKDKLNFKRKLEEHFENKKLEDELYNY